MRRTTTLAVALLLLIAGSIAAHAQSELWDQTWYIQNQVRTEHGLYRFMAPNGNTELTTSTDPLPSVGFKVMQIDGIDKIWLYSNLQGQFAGHIPSEAGQAVPLVNDNERVEYTLRRQDDGSWAIIDAKAPEGQNALQYAADGNRIIGGDESDEASHWTFVAPYVFSENDISPGTYYRLFSSRSAADVSCRYLSSQSVYANTQGQVEKGADGSRTVRRTDGSAVLPTLWTLEENAEASSGSYYLIRNANTGLCLGPIADSDGTPVEMSLSDEEAGHYVLNITSKFNSWSIKEGDRWLSALGGDADGTTLGDYPENSDDNTANYWFIVPVTTVPVKIYADTQWASLNLPFAVELPYGLTAYYASEAKNGVLTLTPIEDWELPANTPVFVAPDEPIATDRTYALPILYDNEVPALAADNLLEGTTAVRTGFAENALYVLATDGAKGVLKKNGSVPSVNYNKAYIHVSTFGETAGTAPAYASLQTAPDPSTGIGNAPIATPQTRQAEVYYDLLGRPVSRPAHGIFVTRDGQKVFIP